MTATAYGIVSRLIQLGVAERSSEEIRFTNKFIAHVAHYGDHVRKNKSTASSWRHIFGLFHSELNSINNTEVQTIISLLDYYLHRLEVRQWK